jgi:hypothetical protein
MGFGWFSVLIRKANMSFVNGAVPISGGSSSTTLKLSEFKHPYYTGQEYFWRKWRLTYIGGEAFTAVYLKKLSKREDDVDFKLRKEITYCPAFAKAALNDIRNSIFQRMVDVTREGGDPTYQRAVKGLDGGVDMLGSSMNSFIGRYIIPELLSMSRVGVYVDMPPLSGPTIAHKGDKKPYIYLYRTESIRSWTYDNTALSNEFTSIVLQDEDYELDIETGLPIGTITRYRHVFIGDDDLVHCLFYDTDGNAIDPITGDQTDDYEIVLPIKRIPFVLFEISDSLLTDVADYQIALLNLASSDMNYALKANFPFYTEQFDNRSESPYLKGERSATSTQTPPDAFGNVFSTETSYQEKVREVKVGATGGRQYPIGVERPAFIHPSSEPMTASMAKQQQLKAEIRQLINLTIENLQPKTSGGGIDVPDPTLESGLSYIGMALEHGERKIAEYWALYEGKANATVAYPENYALTSDKDRHQSAKDFQELMPNMPSLTYQREMAKQIATIMLRGKVPTPKLLTVLKEIDAAPVVMGDPVVIASDIEEGLVSLETASAARGYPPGEVEKAKVDHADRLARIATSQAVGKGFGAAAGDTAQARGVPDLGADNKSGSTEKKTSTDTTTDDTVTNKQRGKAAP